MEKQREDRKNKALRAAVVLLLLVLLSFWLLSGLLAKYTSSGDAEDGARVAIFSVSAEGDGKPVIDYGSGICSAEYLITVQNASETAVTYDIILNLEEALPEGTAVILKDGELTGSGESGKDGEQTGGGTLADGAEPGKDENPADGSGLSPEISVNGKTMTFREAGTLQAAVGGEPVLETKKLVFSVETDGFLEEAETETYQTEISFRAEVRFTQTD